MAVTGELTVKVYLDPVSSADAVAVVDAFKRLQELIDAHDVPLSADDRRVFDRGGAALKRAVRFST